MADNTPAAGDSGNTEPQASAIDDLQEAPTDTGWLQVESLRANRDMQDVVYLTRATPHEEK